MFTKSHAPAELRTRETVANSINQVMMRFPVIVEILETLDRADVPLSGDEDIRHGCQRALTTMLAELSRIQPAPEGKISKAEKTARAHLQAKHVDRLVDPDLLQRFEHIIVRILGSQLSSVKGA